MKQPLKKVAGRAGIDVLIRSIPFLAVLSEEEAEHLRGFVINRQFSKNQIILHEEETGDYFYFIYSGEVKAVQSSSDGRERILAIHRSGEFFGEMSILDGKTLPATVVAMEDSKIGLISRDAFNHMLLGNRQVLRGIVAMLCDRLRAAWLMLKVMSFADAEQRIRVVLKNMADHFGLKDQRGTLINLRLTHSEIADLTSVSRETATRVLNRLKASREIEIFSGKRILLKPSFMDKLDFL